MGEAKRAKRDIFKSTLTNFKYFTLMDFGP
jgi:hypothetical protein